MADCPQFPNVPQVEPIYQTPPAPTMTTTTTTTNVSFAIPGQPIFSPIPTTFGFPPIAWSPIHNYPPTSQQPSVYNHSEDEQIDGFDDPVNAVPVQHLQFPLQQSLQLPLQQPLQFPLQQPLQLPLQQPLQLPLQQHPMPLQQQLVPMNPHQVPVFFNRDAGIMRHPDIQSDKRPQMFQHGFQSRTMMNSRNASNKFDTKHEEFRKYLEDSGILSTFSNIVGEIYQDPLRPNDPLEYIQEQLSGSRAETIELSNLRLWCEQYQIKTERLEKELRHVIERLRNYEPYNTDEFFINESSSINACKSCVLEVSKQEHVLRKMEENHNCESFNNNNQ